MIRLKGGKAGSPAKLYTMIRIWDDLRQFHQTTVVVSCHMTSPLPRQVSRAQAPAGLTSVVDQ